MSKDPTATFAVELKDETSGAAFAAAASLENLKTKIADDVKALREMQRAMRLLKGGTSTNVAAFRNLRDQIAAQKASIATAQSKFVSLGGTFGKTTTKATTLTDKIKNVGKTASKTGGPIGVMGGLVTRLAAALANPVGVALALSAALLAVGASAVVATAALVRFGIVSSGARRNEALQIEGLNTLRQQYGRTTASVKAMQGAIDRASDSTNVGRGTLQTYARQLSRAGLRGDALTDAVEAMGIAAMVQGDRGASRFRALAINARLTGGSVRDLAEDYRNRLGPIARRQMLSIGNQTARLRRNLSRLFSGLRIEAFLSSLADIQNLFSQSTISGRALKGIVERLLQPLIDSVATVGPLVVAFFQGIIIGALAVEIAVLGLQIAFRRVFGRSESTKGIDALNVALAAGAVFVGVLVLGVLALGAAFAFALAVVASFVAVFAVVPASLIGIGLSIGVAIGKTIDFFRETNFRQLAIDMIEGLLRGLRSGAAALTRGVERLATGATSAFRSALGISSPSRVFAEFGTNITAGLAQGIDAGTPAVEDATSTLVESPAGGGLGGAVSLTFGDININAGESADPRELAASFRDELASVLEGVSIELGGSPA